MSMRNSGTDRDETKVHGDLGGAERPTGQGDICSPEALGGAAGSRDRDGESVDRGDDGGSEDDREARGKEKPGEAEGV